MATTRIASDSPTPLKVRTFEATATAVFNAIEKSITGALTPSAARAAITTALSSLNTGGDPTTPVNWAEFLDACQRVIDCVEANTHPLDRQKLFAVAKLYLQSLIDDIVASEREYESDRGLFMLNSQTLDLAYFAGVLEKAEAETQTITFE